MGLWFAMIINTHAVCVQSTAVAHYKTECVVDIKSKCAHICLFLFSFCVSIVIFRKLKKQPIWFRISNLKSRFLARTFCWLALCDFQLHGRQWLLHPSSTTTAYEHRPPSVHNWYRKMCVKIREMNVFNFFYRCVMCLRRELCDTF